MKNSAVPPKGQRRVLVFGVFDLLHPGHLAFLRTAQKFGGELIIVVARDRVVQRIKKRLPRESQLVRLANIKKILGVTRAILGDERAGAYTAIKRYHPHVIALGYDQNELLRDLEKRIKRGVLPSAQLVQLESYESHRFKSSKFDVHGKKEKVDKMSRNG